MNDRNTPKTAFLLSVLLLLSGCAKTTVQEKTAMSESGLSRPEMVFVADFAANPADIELSSAPLARLARDEASQAAEERQLGREVSGVLADELVQRIGRMGLRAARLQPGTPLPRNCLVVSGRILRIDEGNRLRRTVVGLGAGQSALDTAVSLLVPTPTGSRELFAFNTHTDSGAAPGAAVMGPAGAAAGAGTAAIIATNAAKGAIQAHQSAAAEQASQAAAEIASRLGEYFFKQGWVNPATLK